MEGWIGRELMLASIAGGITFALIELDTPKSELGSGCAGPVLPDSFCLVEARSTAP